MPFADLSLNEWHFSSRPIGVSVDSSHASSVTSGTSDCLKKTDFFGSRPHARKSSATSREFLRRSVRVEQRGHRVIIRDEIKRLAFFLKLDGGPHHPEIISEVQRAAGLDA